ncbi:MAG: hypothetical protein LH468_01220 [Nocardioides sp.]|nr:hypothetical protein [Nocardioides sp.]
MRRWLVLGCVAVLGVGLLVAVRGLGGTVQPFFAADVCSATVDGSTVTLSPEQAQNAGLISAIAVSRSLPARAASIALATAYQESKLVNLDYGDRDSLGLFQQRPSMGWGTQEQVSDPVYATNRFYDELVEVEGYRDLEVTEAAQAVQRSGFPMAYADHEADARVLASAFTGNSAAAFSCRLGSDIDTADATLVSSGLTARAEVLRRDVREVFGDVPLGGFAPGGVSSGHSEDSAHYDGRAVDIFVRPISPGNTTKGWAMAQYLVSQAQRLGISTVIFDAKIWTVRRSSSGWRDYTPDTSGRDAATAAILEHRDHVHVDVFD